MHTSIWLVPCCFCNCTLSLTSPSWSSFSRSFVLCLFLFTMLYPVGFYTISRGGGKFSTSKTHMHTPFTSQDLTSLILWSFNSISTTFAMFSSISAVFVWFSSLRFPHSLVFSQFCNLENVHPCQTWKDSIISWPVWSWYSGPQLCLNFHWRWHCSHLILTWKPHILWNHCLLQFSPLLFPLTCRLHLRCWRLCKLIPRRRYERQLLIKGVIMAWEEVI